MGSPTPHRILVVEDNELNLKLFGDLLEARGHEVLSASDGETALHMARRDQPHLVLMDIQLPRISGLEVIRWMKEDDAVCDIPIIAITAHAMKGDEERILDSGCDGYMSKPISVATFFESVNRFLPQPLEEDT